MMPHQVQEEPLRNTAPKISNSCSIVVEFHKLLLQLTAHLPAPPCMEMSATSAFMGSKQVLMTPGLQNTTPSPAAAAKALYCYSDHL